MDFGSIKGPRGEQAIQWGLGLVISAVDFGADVNFGFELGGRLKEVLEPEKFFGIEGVQKILGFRRFPALGSEEAADMGKILLFDMRVIVFLVRT